MKFWLGLLLACLLLTKGFTQPNPSLSPEQIQAYAQIGKTWGFLKFYHPQVASGALNWDQALIQALQNESHPSPQTMSRRVVQELLTLAGPVENCRTCLNQVGSTFSQTVDWAWLSDTAYISASQSVFLKRIRDQRDAKDSIHRHYIQTWKGGSFKFILDSTYQEIGAFTPAERLLPLFHYWNVIEYFSPYKPSIHPHWDQVLIEFIPQFLNAEGKRAMHYTMWELTSRLKDSHGAGGSGYLYEHGYGKFWLPFWARLSEDKDVFITQSRSDSLFQASNLQVGDQILQINGQDVRQLLDDKRPFVSASNATAEDIYALWKILQDTLPWAELTLKRHEEVFVQKIARQEPSQFHTGRLPTWYWADSAHEILVVQNQAIRSSKQARKVLSQAKAAKAIIMDFRQGSMPYDAMTHFQTRMTQNEAPSANYYFSKFSFPGYWSSKGIQQTFSRRSKHWKEKELILLVGEYNISRDEWWIMRFQTSPQAYTIGRSTGGALSYMAKIQLVGGYAANFTMGGMTYPDGSPIFGPGVKLDERVEPSSQQLREGRDADLERALEYLTSKPQVRTN